MSTMCIAIGQCGTNIAGRLLQQHSQLLTDHNVSVMLVDSSVNTLSAHQIVFGEDMQGAHAVHLRSSIVKGLGTMAKPGCQRPTEAAPPSGADSSESAAVFPGHRKR